MDLFDNIINNIDDFTAEVDCTYKGEHYSVRDNGAIMRHARKDMRKRKLDNEWSLGTFNKATGYMEFGGERVHRIVAVAFHGEPPTDQHVVDHIDTNRCNNRPENLRWLTKLENILNNEITRKKVELICGSIEAFLENPQLLFGHESLDNNFSWMKSVSKEEAKYCLEHWNHWAKTAKPNPNYKKTENNIGDWMYNSSQVPYPEDNPLMRRDVEEQKVNIIPETQIQAEDYEEDEYEPQITQSLTPNAVQVDWRVPSEFPCCPKEPTDKPLEAYKSNLKVNAVFCENKWYSSLVVDSAIADEGESLIVMTISAKEAVKPWAVSRVSFYEGIYVHEGLGIFFEENGAEKQFTLAQGKEWTGEDSIDDCC